MLTDRAIVAGMKLPVTRSDAEERAALMQLEAGLISESNDSGAPLTPEQLKAGRKRLMKYMETRALLAYLGPAQDLDVFRAWRPPRQLGCA